MLRLILIRHAHAAWDEQVQADVERPLTRRGWSEAAAMAARLAAETRPDRLLSSPARRALSTAERFAEALALAPGAIVTDPRIYEADSVQLLGVVREQPDAARCIALFGHNPGISRFAADLCGRELNELPTCALAEAEIDADRWQQVRTGSARLVRLWAPEALP